MKRKNSGKFLLFIVVLLGLALVVAACGGAAPDASDSGGAASEASDGGEEAASDASDGDEEASEESDGGEEAAGSGESITVQLAENPWSGSQVNVAVAKILLEEEMGHTVELITIDENAQWPALASGDLHASLEVWPSGHAENVAQYIDDQGVVENAGLLGPMGVIGWFMPKYMLDKDSDLETWEGFTKPETGELFSTAETGDKGQFLAGDPSWVQYDADIINNLGMNFEVVTAGSEEAILAALDSAYSREEPIVFYFWTPHSVHAQFELVQVELPAYSDECYDTIDAGGVDCAYPSDDLFKIVASSLKDDAPDVYQFLKNFNYSTQDQIQMIAAVELDGKSAEEAAREWIEGNEDTWRAWIP